MLIDDIEIKDDSPQKSKQPIDQNYLTLKKNLQYLLQHYQLESVQQMIGIILDYQYSSDFKQKFPQYSNLHQTELKLSEKLKKIAVQHTYQQMYIYYHQFPIYLKQCRKVIKYKYRFDDILRTHQNRKSIWLLCSGAYFKIKQHPNYYQKLTQTQDINPQFFKTSIQKDVVRTATDKHNHRPSDQKYSNQNQIALNRVLRNFAIRNPYIGYCQGMNFIVNFLILMQFNQQQAFWITTELLQSYLPKSYYTNMMGIAVDIYIIEQYVKFYHADLYDKIQQLNLNLSLITLEWLVCLFTTTLPFYMLVIVWDMLFIHGPSILLKVCIVILEYLQQTILNTKDLAQFLTILQTKKNNIFIDQDTFINKISNIYIDIDLLDLCRSMVEIKLKKQKIKLSSEIKVTISKKTPHLNCDISWPICFKALNQHKSDQGQIQVWTFREDGPVKIINQYLTMKKKKMPIPSDSQKSQHKKLMIGRIPHVCNFQQYNKKIDNQSIQMQEYDYSQRRRNIQSSLASWAFNLKQSTNNQHLEFYKRVSSSNILLLQMKNQKKDSKSPKQIKKWQSPLRKVKDKNITGSLVLQDGKIVIKQKYQAIKKFQNKRNSQSFSVNKIQQNSKNPFKKLKSKLKDFKEETMQKILK